MRFCISTIRQLTINNAAKLPTGDRLIDGAPTDSVDLLMTARRSLSLLARNGRGADALLMCHGAGGITGHYRFGARTATAPALIGLSFLLMGLLLGEGAVALLALVPAAVLGTLLFFSGVELALSSKPGSYAGVELFAVLAIGAVSATYNPAVAFALGLPLGLAVRRGWVRL